MTTYRFYSDPHHGWLKVLRQELVDLRIADKISHYSYQRGKWVYLEAHRDLTLFCSVRGEFETVGSYSNNSSRIRSYDSYK